jgi:hypothetical protein
VRKVWEALALFVIIIIVLSIVSDAIQPYMPIIGITAAALILIALVILLFRLVISRRKFW